MAILDQSLADRLRDLTATGEKQRAGKSFDAAVDTFRTALAILPADVDAELREDLEWRLSVAECNRDTTRSVSRLLAEARYDQTAGRLAESYRHLTDALSLDPANEEAVTLKQQLSAQFPLPPQATTQTGPHPAFEIETRFERDDPPEEVPAPVLLAPDAVEQSSATLPETVPIPSFALLENEDVPTAAETRRSAVIILGAVVLALVIIWVCGSIRRTVNLDAQGSRVAPSPTVQHR